MKLYGKLRLIIAGHGIFLYNKVFSKNSQERESDLIESIPKLMGEKRSFLSYGLKFYNGYIKSAIFMFLEGSNFIFTFCPILFSDVN